MPIYTVTKLSWKEQTKITSKVGTFRFETQKTPHKVHRFTPDYWTTHENGDKISALLVRTEQDALYRTEWVLGLSADLASWVGFRHLISCL